MKKVSEGAESSIYAVEFLGIQCVLKRRAPKRYRINEIDETLRNQRTRNEARITGIAAAAGCRSPRVVLVGKYDIVMTSIDGTMLNDMLDSAGSALMSSIGRQLAALHNSGVTHGDFTPANIIVGKDGSPHVIDFGLSEITNSIEERALDLLLMKRSVSAAQYSALAKTYAKSVKDWKSISGRLSEVEKRGRYNVRTMLSARLIHHSA